MRGGAGVQRRITGRVAHGLDGGEALVVELDGHARAEALGQPRRDRVRGVKAGDVVKVAAGVVGGGGGGRDTIAQAGGREPAKLPEALDAARAAIASALGVS